MDGLSKIVTLLATAMVVLCLVGIATPAFAQDISSKGMANAKGMPQANAKGMPQANANANAGKGMAKGGAEMGGAAAGGAPSGGGGY